MELMNVPSIMYNYNINQQQAERIFFSHMLDPYRQKSGFVLVNGDCNALIKKMLPHNLLPIKILREKHNLNKNTYSKLMHFERMFKFKHGVKYIDDKQLHANIKKLKKEILKTG